MEGEVLVQTLRPFSPSIQLPGIMISMVSLSRRWSFRERFGFLLHAGWL